jgi:hypothetical protein
VTVIASNAIGNSTPMSVLSFTQEGGQSLFIGINNCVDYQMMLCGRVGILHCILQGVDNNVIL